MEYPVTTMSSYEIVTALAHGANPATGEQLDPGNPLNHPAILRALFEAREALEERSRLQARRRSLPARTGAPWTPADEEVLVDRFSSGKSFQEIARELERSSGAVQARLIKLGKLEDTGQLRFSSRNTAN